ncbi:LacI family DNA-binding transcriptional regulator [Sporolactobacillus sp. Y61]|uniref:LacI family DNA-binding transcriptional regulator n=1 Tax=Sporolactobacillus sp. Y61 TaxID=3160863 RepID=A0AAU8IIU5_9BACL
MKKISMQDIADKLHISKNSVSQALGDKGGVSEQTKMRVRKTAEEMGYDYRKRATFKQNTPHHKNTFALFATDFALSHKSFFGEIIRYIEKEMKKYGNELCIFRVSPENISSNSLPAAFSKSAYQGLFILSHINRPFIQLLLDLQLPTVMIDHHDPHLDTDCVLCQNKTGGYLATEFLINQGHKKIGFLGDIDWSPSYEERWEGYMKALRDNQLPVEKALMITGIQEKRSVLYKELEALANKVSDLPTAWLCANSGMGFILISYFQSIGYRIPEDISVCCFDNTEFTVLSNPQITTMAIDLRDMGRKAVQLLEWRLDHPSHSHLEIRLPAHLIERESTSAVSLSGK